MKLNSSKNAPPGALYQYMSYLPEKDRNFDKKFMGIFLFFIVSKIVKNNPSFLLSSFFTQIFFHNTEQKSIGVFRCFFVRLNNSCHDGFFMVQ